HPSPSRARSATASGRLRTVSRKRLGTVCPRVCSASISFVTCCTRPPCACRPSPYVAHRLGARARRVLHREGWKTCGKWWILSAVRPEEIVGAPGARVLYSTSSGRAVFRGPSTFVLMESCGRRTRSGNGTGQRMSLKELEPLRETAVVERSEGVIAVQPREHPSGLLAPRHRRRRRRPPHDLGVPALVDVVLGPRPRVVLRAGDLDEGHVARGAEPARPVAVRVP